MNQARVESLERLFFPTGFPRQGVFKKVGQEFVLRLLDDKKSKESVHKLYQRKDTEAGIGIGRIGVGGP